MVARYICRQMPKATCPLWKWYPFSKSAILNLVSFSCKIWDANELHCGAPQKCWGRKNGLKYKRFTKLVRPNHALPKTRCSFICLDNNHSAVINWNIHAFFSVHQSSSFALVRNLRNAVSALLSTIWSFVLYYAIASSMFALARLLVRRHAAGFLKDVICLKRNLNHFLSLWSRSSGGWACHFVDSFLPWPGLVAGNC